MSLKQIIKENNLLKDSKGLQAELVLPGEPMIYCIKYPVGQRHRPAQYFRNAKWRSILKCFFRSYYYTNVPVVVIVRFYVSPPSSVHLSSKDLRKETVPAVHSYELCDYLLSFFEMIHHVLINSYKQVVRVEVDKFYSDNPRTVFKFMKWDHYVNLKNNNTLYPETQGISQDGKARTLQSKRKRNASNTNSCQETPGCTPFAAPIEWTPPSDSPLPDTFAPEST